MKHVSLVLPVVAALLTGCATSAVPTSETAVVPPGRVLSSAFAKKAAGHATLHVKRDSGWSNAACSFRVYVNGSPQVDLRTGESFAMYLPPGEYILGATPGFCGAGDAETSVTLKANEVKSYRVGVDAGGAMRVSPTAF